MVMDTFVSLHLRRREALLLDSGCGVGAHRRAGVSQGVSQGVRKRTSPRPTQTRTWDKKVRFRPCAPRRNERKRIPHAVNKEQSPHPPGGAKYSVVRAPTTPARLLR